MKTNFHVSPGIASAAPVILTANVVSELKNTPGLILSAVLTEKFIAYIYISALALFALTLTFIILLWFSKNKTEKKSKTSQKDLLNERNQLRTLIDNIPDFIYIKDRKSRFVIANESVAHHMRVKSSHDLIGKNDFDFYPSELATQFFTDEQKIIKAGNPLTSKEEPSIDPQNNRLIISTTKVPLRDFSGKIIGIVGIGRNVTDQRKAAIEVEKGHQQIANERNLLRTLINNIPDFIYIKDSDSRFIMGNKRIAEVMGADSPEDLSGKTDMDYYPYDLAKKFYEDEQRIMKTGIPLINHEERGLNEYGVETHISTSKVPVRNFQGEITGIVGIGRDITSLKKTEEKLRRKSEDLQEINVLLEERQEEVQQQAEELNSQAEHLREINSELHRLNATKDKFFSIIAHDLKNPFSAITSLSEILIRDFKGMPEEEKLKLMKLVKVSSENAYSLLENLLHWARSQTGRISFNPQPVDLKEIIEHNIEFLKISSDRKNIKLINKLKKCYPVYADKNMINLIVRNLMSNAIKFTQTNGKITISCVANEEYVQLDIADTGVGISKDDIGKLFRIDEHMSYNGTSGETGTGLGLIICKEFISKNKGEIFVKSKPEKGSTFSITIPISPVSVNQPVTL
ncbi:MAG TPA: PAS domain-containing sensor histidine kinase [Bacteroidales bacterium]|nr:PAS domain-containing sensor histidine kinase [Bacteroidales bacterium]